MNDLRSKIGQLLIFGFSGYEINQAHPIANWIQEDHLGGVILFDYDMAQQSFGKNIRSFSQVQQLTHQLQDLTTEPLLIAIDYEGGAVDRLASIQEGIQTQSAYNLAQLSNDAFEEIVNAMAKQLQQLGFNLNFAPVVDLDLNRDSGIMGRLNRCFSADALVVYQKASQWMEIFNRYGIVSCLKHFPGHGSATGDTHTDFVDVTSTFQTTELTPYRQLIETYAKPFMVMTAHVINHHLDASGLPATLSYPILTQHLRDDMGYQGVIISDDLQMSAISKHYSLAETLRLTLNAGADMMIFANQLDDMSPKVVIDQIERLVQSNKIDINRIENAYQRVVALKNRQRPEVSRGAKK